MPAPALICSLPLSLTRITPSWFTLWAWHCWKGRIPINTTAIGIWRGLQISLAAHPLASRYQSTHGPDIKEMAAKMQDGASISPAPLLWTLLQWSAPHLASLSQRLRQLSPAKLILLPEHL